MSHKDELEEAIINGVLDSYSRAKTVWDVVQNKSLIKEGVDANFISKENGDTLLSLGQDRLDELEKEWDK